jgi:hypothetical protein
MIRVALIVPLLLATPALARPDPAPRVEIPIREVDFGGARRYVVTLQIDGQSVEAGLDTGSTGLRVLARALPAPALAASGGRTGYSYSSGVQFGGTAIRGDVAFGALHGEAPLMRIDKIGCKSEQPDCPAAHVDPASYGIQGDGVPGQGFAAILGVGLKEDKVANPFVALGARTWIVELPRPGNPAGRIVLNPNADEIARYATLDMVDDGNNMIGCITAPGHEKICGLTHFDSGAPGIRIMTASRFPPWPQGTPAEISFGDHKHSATMAVTIGLREQASGMLVIPRPDAREPVISLGLAPYFRWSVLYDAAGHRIGLRER